MSCGQYTDGRVRVIADQWLPGRTLAAVLTDFDAAAKADAGAYGFLRVMKSTGEWAYYLVRPWDWVVYFPDGLPPIRMDERQFYRLFEPVVP